MRALRDIPIRRKLTIISLLTSAVALGLACGALVVYEQLTFRRTLTRDLSILATMLGANSAADLSFNDTRSAAQTLGGLRAQPHVIAACLYNAEGQVFATYQREPAAAVAWPEPGADREQFSRESLRLFRRIELAGETIGTIFLESDLEEMHARMRRYALVVGGIILVAALVAFLTASRLQRLVAEPIAHLAAIAGRVGSARDYSARAVKRGNDELGQLVDVFNDMVAQIQSRETDLERRVEERTRELQAEYAARKALEAQLRQVQKMETVGQLAGGIAHDFNNILTAMLLSLELLDEEKLPPKATLPLRDLQTMVRRAARLTEQLLLFARKHVMRTETLELNAVLAHLLKMLRRLLGEHLSIELISSPQPLWIEADASMLDQVVMNLCVNARDAMPEGGRLTLEARLVELSAESASPIAEARPGRFACLRVTDTGCGMPPDVLAHVFEPFFTTKETGKGTGLGLATVHGIVHQHQGWVGVESAAGQGTTFRVYLPLSTRAATTEPAPAAAEIERGAGTILLVEDEEAVRRLTSGLLRRLGYRVLAAGNGAEALQLWSEHLGVIDLLLTDMVMPNGMSGIQLTAELRKARPTLKVVVMTGYSAEIVSTDALRPAGVAFLSKPFDLNTLASTLRASLR